MDRQRLPFLRFTYSNRRMVHVPSLSAINTDKMQTPVKSVCIAIIFYNYIIIPNCCQENRGCRTIGGKKLLCHNIFLPLFSHREYKDTTHPKNGVLCIYSVTLLAPKKHCGTTTFRCKNCCPVSFVLAPKKRRLGRYFFTRSNIKKEAIGIKELFETSYDTPHRCILDGTGDGMEAELLEHLSPSRRNHLRKERMNVTVC